MDLYFLILKKNYIQKNKTLNVFNKSIAILKHLNDNEAQ